ncbi:MAG TPA: hypothetical protein VD866_10975 [Urbifossiella sp.]|nr:hypothetical protein [Urbifossiella sp.]
MKPLPTRAAPGSSAKLLTLAERAALGLPLFAADDATFATAEAGSAPERLRDVKPRAFIVATRPTTTPPPAVVEVPPAAEGGRPVPGLTLHRGVRVWRAVFKNHGRKVAVYFGRQWEAASARYKAWAATWPAPLLADVPPARDRSRIIHTDAGPVRLAEAARAAGIRPGTLAYRLDVLRWPVAVALSTPCRRAG